MATTVHTPEAISFIIAELPQRWGMAYCVHLLYSDGEEQQIGISSHSKRGIRQQMSSHRAFKHLTERVIENGALVAAVTEVAKGARL